MLYSESMRLALDAVERALPSYLPNTDTLQGVVSEAMAYACSAGGKRIRPVLLLEFCRICGGRVADAMPYACAIEMIHSYSLVHDDLPCMDNSPLRRGKPSVHVQYGEDMALLAGDALLNRAFECMLKPDAATDISADRRLRAAYVLADAAGINGMVGGQVIDLQSENREIPLAHLELLQEGKTAALIRAACVMGCVLAGADEATCAAADRFGREVGLCFQIVDDILDVTSDEATLGKPVNSDAENTKNTYVSLLGVENSRALAAERTAKAIEALACFGEAGKGLADLADALLHRKV